MHTIYQLANSGYTKKSIDSKAFSYISILNKKSNNTINNILYSKKENGCYTYLTLEVCITPIFISRNYL